MTSSGKTDPAAPEVAVAEGTMSGGFPVDLEASQSLVYRITPFERADLAQHLAATPSTRFAEYFNTRHTDRPVTYTDSGRAALGLALQHLSLGPRDVVTILTTSGNHYVSGCVTEQIERRCRWSRELSPATRAILVIHEFGFPFLERVAELCAYGVPLIEDCAFTFSVGLRDTGRFGDFVVYSFSKFFPIQFGGALVGPMGAEPVERLPSALRGHLLNVLSLYVDAVGEIGERRRENYRGLVERFGRIGCAPRFVMGGAEVPGAFVFRVPVPPGTDLNGLKTFMRHHGVESSVLYHEPSFFLPVHHRLAEVDFDYFAELTAWYLQHNLSAASGR